MICNSYSNTIVSSVVGAAAGFALGYVGS